MGGLAGSQSRQHPSVMINSTRADITTISCMVASQYGRWARSRYSGEAGAASPVCCSTCSKRRRTSSSAASMSTSMRSKAPVAAVAQGRDVRVGRRGAPAPFTNSSPSSVKLPQTTGAASPRVGSVLIKSLARQGARAHQKNSHQAAQRRLGADLVPLCRRGSTPPRYLSSADLAVADSPLFARHHPAAV